MASYDDYRQLDDAARARSLLPPVYKWVGAGVAVAGVAAYFTLLSTTGEALASYAGGMATMLGLALAVFSRERNEDELTRKLRLEAAYWAGMIGVGLLVGINTGSFFLEGNADLYGGTGLMIALLCFHLAKFHSARRRLQKEEPAEA